MPDLDRYWTKRTAGATPEPMGGEVLATGTHRFVVHKHDATRLHYDLRLEWDGVLLSWAVPRYIPWDPADKRLAVETEPHPIEYATFEGVIPDGNYGAGPMIVWDRGHFVPLEPLGPGLEKGKLLFELLGYKLHGVFTLVRTKRAEKDWLLIKKPDAWAREGEPSYDETSVLSGMPVESLAETDARREAMEERLRALGVPKRPMNPREVEPMLAKTAEGPFTDPDWLFELKYDGYRALLWRDDGGAGRATYRSGRDATALYPELCRAVAALPWRGVVLDGEIVVLDGDGRPVFNGIQQRGQLSKAKDIERAAISTPVTYFAFDLLGLLGYDLRALTLEQRKTLLAELMPRFGPLRYADHVDGAGEAFHALVARQGLEGIMAKRRKGLYRSGRHDDWLKLPMERVGDFVVFGFSEARGSRVGFRSLLLAGRGADGSWVSVGRVGSGFDNAELEGFHAELMAQAVAECPVAGPFDREGSPTFVRPSMVVEVRFKEWSPDGNLRIPTFSRRRLDKTPDEVEDGPPRGREIDGEVEEEPPDPVSEVSAARELVVTNATKIYFPEHGLTKGDLVDYYVAVAPWLLPLLDDRPLVLTRLPDGIHGKSFFQKDAPSHVPDWIRRERMWSEENNRITDFLVADSAEALGWIANSGAIPIHVWQSRVATIQNPDFTVVDLDPKGAPFSDVITLALALREVCEAAGLPCYVKTSGSTGMHVIVPLGRLVTYEQSRMIAMLLSKVVLLQHADIGTTLRKVDAREGKVYLDTFQNGHGRLIVGPYSVRPRPGAPVSTPLRWDEVQYGLDPDVFTIKTVIPRLLAHGDPLRPHLDDVPDLVLAIDRLAQRLA